MTSFPVTRTLVAPAAPAAALLVGAASGAWSARAERPA
jgi:hypothetical protein